MEQQETKLPLEWLSSRRTPELHRLEALCRETAREERCAQRRLQEVEEAMAPEPERSCPAPAPEAAERAKLEQLSRQLNAANAELRRYETRMFAYERTILALRKENADLSARCDVLHAEVEKLAAEALKPLPELPPAHHLLPRRRKEGRRAAPGGRCVCPCASGCSGPAQDPPRTSRR